MRKIVPLLILMGFFLGIIFHQAEGNAISLHSKKIKASSSPPYEAAILVEADTGKIIFGKNIHKRWPPASMNKMMLMLIVMEKVEEGEIGLEDKITISARASRMGGSQVYLKEGEVFTLEDLMKAVVIASANDACVAIAEYIAGSPEAFVDMMNEKAQELGMKYTHYGTVHGLPPEPGQEEDLTCAYDMAILARRLVKYPKIIEWCSTWQAPFRDGKFILTNHNKLLKTFAGCDGIKTGFIAKSKYNLTATAKRGNLRFISVIMGAPTDSARFSESARLLSMGFNHYKKVLVIKKGEVLGPEIKVSKGTIRKIRLVAADDISAIIRRGQEKNLVTKFHFPTIIRAPLAKGTKIGKIIIKAGDAVIAKGDAVIPRDIPKASFFQRLFSW